MAKQKGKENNVWQYTKFNPENKETLSYGETLNPAMEITEKLDAVNYLKDYAFWIAERKNYNFEAALEIARENILYYAGYYDNETQARVRVLFSK